MLPDFKTSPEQYTIKDGVEYLDVAKTFEVILMRELVKTGKVLICDKEETPTPPVGEMGEPTF